MNKTIILNLSKLEYLDDTGKSYTWNNDISIFSDINHLCIILPIVPFSQQRRTMNIINVLKTTNYTGHIQFINPLNYLDSFGLALYKVDKHYFHNFQKQWTKDSLCNINFPDNFVSNHKEYGKYIDCSAYNLYKLKINHPIQSFYCDQYEKEPKANKKKL